MRPQSINIFEILAYVAVAAAAIALIVLYAGMMDYGVDEELMIVIIIMLLITVGAGVAAIFAARNRSTGGKWTFVGLGVTAILFFLVGLAGFIDGPWYGLLLHGPMAIFILTFIAAVVFVMQRDATFWFAGAHHPGGYPPQPGAWGGPQGGYPPPQGSGYPPPPNYPPQPGAGFPPQHGQPQGGYPPAPGGGYPPQQGGGYPPQGGGDQR